MLRGLRPKTSAAPLLFGSAYHECLELYDKLRAQGKDGLPAAIRLAYELSTPGTLGNDTARTRMTLLRALIWYAYNWQNDQFETFILADGRPAVELSFRIELPMELDGEPVIYCGHIDRVAKYNDQLYAMEHKHTTSALSDYYYARYTFSSQITGYILALRVMYDLRVVGGVVDSTQVGVTFARFGRRVAQRVDGHVDEWLHDTMQWIRQLHFAQQHNLFIRNTESCSRYSGCQFKDVCFANPAVRETILEADFQYKPWDPMKIRGDEA
jgi:hypothetical protein